MQPLWRFLWAIVDALRVAWRVAAWRLSLRSNSYARRAKAYTDPFLVAVVTEGGAVSMRAWLNERGLRGQDIEIDAETWHDVLEMLAAENAAQAQDMPMEDLN